MIIVTRCYSLILVLKRQITKYPMLAILIPLTIRVIPEVLMGAWPVGFDVITYYAPYMHDVKKYGLTIPFLDILLSQTAPLTYVASGLIALIIPLDSLILAKILSPLIYGFLGFAVYDFSKNIFRWKPKKALLAAIISSLYFVTLRFSWDMWKNTIGLAFFLLSISCLEIGKYGKFLVYSLLCVLSHELMAVFLGTVLTIVLFEETLSGIPQNRIRSITVILIIAFSLFGAVYYTGWVKIFLQPQPTIPTELILRREALTVPYNYLSGEDWYSYASEWDVRLEASALMLKMYAPIFLPAIFGWKRNRWMDSCILISVLPFLSIILSPSVAIPSWHRFAFLLAIPLLIHAANFISDKRKVKLFFVAFLVIFMFGYVLFSSEAAFPYYTIFPSTYRYLPTSMLQNSVSKEDLANVMNILNWLNSQVVSKSCLLVHESYLGWAKLYSDREIIDIIPYNMSSIMPKAAKKYYSHVYAIWWAEDANQNGGNLPSQFRQINQMGRIAVYEYECIYCLNI